MTDDLETDREEQLALAAEYALGLLSDEEVQAFETLLSVDPDFRDAYALWAEDFAGLTEDLASEVPPKTVWSGIEGSLFPDSKQSLLQRLGLVPAIIGGLLAALLVLFVTDRTGLIPLGTDDGGPAMVAEIAAEDRSLLVQAAYDPATNALSLERTAGAAPEGRVLELWIIIGENAPVSLGVLPDDGAATIEMPETLQASIGGAVLALTDEPPGGSPTGAPTGDVLAIGAVTSL